MKMEMENGDEIWRWKAVMKMEMESGDENGNGKR